MGGASYAQESIYTEVFGDTVIIHHNQVQRNCGALYRIDYELEDDFLLNIFEVDTGLPAYCLCIFDLSVTLNDLPAGTYTANIYDVEDGGAGDTTFCGTTEFNILNGGFISKKLSDFQSACYSVSDISDASPEIISISPNPCKNEFKINCDRTLFGQLCIYDLSGKCLIKKEFNNKTVKEVGSLKSGVYLLKLITEQGIFIEKIIKE